jgi:hypothetical protein
MAESPRRIGEHVCLPTGESGSGPNAGVLKLKPFNHGGQTRLALVGERPAEVAIRSAIESIDASETFGGFI